MDIGGGAGWVAVAATAILSSLCSAVAVWVLFRRTPDLASCPSPVAVTPVGVDILVGEQVQPVLRVNRSGPVTPSAIRDGHA